MPLIKIDHVVSFSSEDPVHSADNIISTNITKKWKCRTPGEKQASIVLQLERATQITAIDIGNEHSAYVEILVSRSSSNDDFHVLLVTSVFMTPLESRQSQNVNKVRMFTQDQLSKPVCYEKWDRIKIVCSQPYNKHVKYGLSFINLHSNEVKGGDTPKMAKLGNFLIKPESPDPFIPGSLFARRKESKQDEKPTAAAAIRDAIASPSLASPSFRHKLKPKNINSSPNNNNQPAKKDRNREELFYTDEDKQKNEKIDKIMKKKDEEDKLKKKEEPKRKKLFDVEDSTSSKKQKVDKDMFETKKINKSPQINTIDNTKNSKQTGSSIEKNKIPKTVQKPKITKPFNKLLDNVILVISGIQNPERAQLRKKAFAMGAKYKADWDPTCTHLICAFPNTPKFNQVKGKGKIITKNWIQMCHDERKRFPWRRFALDKNDANGVESEDEIYESINTPSTIPSRSNSSNDDSDIEEQPTRVFNKNDKHKQQELYKVPPTSSTHDVSDDDNEIKTDTNISKNSINVSSSDEETDVESSFTKPELGIYEADTDEETGLSISLNKTPPDIFHGQKFYVDHSFGEEKYEMLLKYVLAYNGKSTDDITSNIDIIVTTPENSSSMKEINHRAKCVKDSWLIECHKKQKMLPITNFIF